jgi:hypothetical protein
MFHGGFGCEAAWLWSGQGAAAANIVGTETTVRTQARVQILSGHIERL